MRPPRWVCIALIPARVFEPPVYAARGAAKPHTPAVVILRGFGYGIFAVAVSTFPFATIVVTVFLLGRCHSLSSFP